MKFWKQWILWRHFLLQFTCWRFFLARNFCNTWISVVSHWKVQWICWMRQFCSLIQLLEHWLCNVFFFFIHFVFCKFLSNLVQKNFWHYSNTFFSPAIKLVRWGFSFTLAFNSLSSMAERCLQTFFYLQYWLHHERIF